MSFGKSLLLDTQLWVWLVLAEKGEVKDAAWKKVRAAVAADLCAVSEITFWEIAVKARKKKLSLPPDPKSWLREARKKSRVSVVSVDREILVDSALLDAHPDPADRVLIATAERYGLQLATTDEEIIAYASRTKTLHILDVRA